MARSARRWLRRPDGGSLTPRGLLRVRRRLIQAVLAHVEVAVEAVEAVVATVHEQPGPVRGGDALVVGGVEGAAAHRVLGTMEDVSVLCLLR